jgi:hypothetical protein
MVCIYDICRRWVYVEQLKSTQACQVLLSRKTLGVAHLCATFAVTSLTGHQAFKQYVQQPANRQLHIADTLYNMMITRANKFEGLQDLEYVPMQGMCHA